LSILPGAETSEDNVKRIILPIVLAVLGMTLLIGCFYLPVSPRPTGNGSTDKLFNAVGDRHSWRALRVGTATRDQVLSIAPDPWKASADGKSLVYSTMGAKGYIIWPLCFMASPDEVVLQLRLDFDDNGVLRSYQLDHDDQNTQDMGAGMLWQIDDQTRTRRNPWPPPLTTTRQNQNP
jgi:hypothetical protein